MTDEANEAYDYTQPVTGPPVDLVVRDGIAQIVRREQRVGVESACPRASARTGGEGVAAGSRSWSATANGMKDSVEAATVPWGAAGWARSAAFSGFGVR
ncbi:hypothetical protein GCM10009779_70100 [Polymorphospora rubra]|uniref:Uncharacterized protein n=1 Tax=Polymorphospora rubra TaxID=338584 RepID=A0A810N6L8_9ACTN|nr:hypothetical protein Prubr_64320 [Polymorphospora rubra]